MRSNPVASCRFAEGRNECERDATIWRASQPGCWEVVPDQFNRNIEGQRLSGSVRSAGDLGIHTEEAVVGPEKRGPGRSFATVRYTFCLERFAICSHSLAGDAPGVS